MTDLHWTIARAGSWDARVLEGGDGTPLVCLHGSGDTAFVWKPVIEEVLPDHRACAVDFGESRRAQGDAGAGRLAEDGDLLAGVLERLGGPAHLVGHSYGALLALRFALAHPGRLRSLCLVEPIAFGLLHDEHGRHPPGSAIARTFEGFFRAWRGGDRTAALALIVDYWNGAGAWEAMGRPRQERIGRGAERFGAEVTCAHDDATREAELRALALPTLVANGGRTTPEARTVCAILARAVPSARALRVESAGHSPMRSHPARLAAALREHLAAADAAS